MLPVQCSLSPLGSELKHSSSDNCADFMLHIMLCSSGWGSGVMFLFHRLDKFILCFPLFFLQHQESQIPNGNKFVSFEYKPGMDNGRTGSSSDRESQ